MKRILLLCLATALFVIGNASAYGLYLSCTPTQISVSQTLKCSVNSDFPAGTSFDLVFYRSQYTTTEISRQSVTLQGGNATPQYRLFDTKGLQAGQYKVEVQFSGTEASSLRSGSITDQIIQLVDRSGDITITSPMTQTIGNALLVGGSIANEGNNGVELKVTGETTGQVVFQQQYIRTTSNGGTSAGVFSQQVTITQPDDYDAEFDDVGGYIGTVTFHVVSPTPVPTATTIPVATAPLTTTPALTPPPTPVVTPTKSPLPVTVVIGALGICIVLSSGLRKKQK
jgi:hypothetical protein